MQIDIGCKKEKNDKEEDESLLKKLFQVLEYKINAVQT
jgi:hypothetical protein